MGFKMKGFSGFKEKKENRKFKKAQRLVRKNVKNTTVDAPGASDVSDRKFRRSEKKITKAVDILRDQGYPKAGIEDATGAGGYKAAMEFSKKRKKK
tara:strand:+ start:126 stop:413 length:288 start_codon:yes stop_codon:yes gene_type:complete